MYYYDVNIVLSSILPAVSDSKKGFTMSQYSELKTKMVFAQM